MPTADETLKRVRELADSWANIRAYRVVREELLKALGESDDSEKED